MYQFGCRSGRHCVRFGEEEVSKRVRRWRPEEVVKCEVTDVLEAACAVCIVSR